jgi:hypothetical protein
VRCICGTWEAAEGPCPLHWDTAPPREPEPSTEDYCGADGHTYCGDDEDTGRCYCGQKLYPLGGPPQENPT